MLIPIIKNNFKISKDPKSTKATSQRDTWTSQSNDIRDI
jgi:hypothetical protein